MKEGTPATVQTVKEKREIEREGVNGRSEFHCEREEGKEEGKTRIGKTKQGNAIEGSSR